mmetsp:Transcript_34569/g.57650  ORF Transcript_34569/g.57650 Transcript_34569/m.57650 type:complete len:206 (+) Transcript_34569:2654-3271(+)
MLSPEIILQPIPLSLETVKLPLHLSYNLLLLHRTLLGCSALHLQLLQLPLQNLHLFLSSLQELCLLFQLCVLLGCSCTQCCELCLFAPAILLHLRRLQFILICFRFHLNGTDFQQPHFVLRRVHLSLHFLFVVLSSLPLSNYISKCLLLLRSALLYLSTQGLHFLFSCIGSLLLCFKIINLTGHLALEFLPVLLPLPLLRFRIQF